MAFLGQPTRDVAVERHPHIKFVIESLDAPPEMRAPKFVLARDVAKGFERNSGLNCPAIGS